MVERNFCQLCNQRDNCRQAYEKLGSSQGPSVVSEVIFAFLVPMLVFIVALAVFEKILAQTPAATPLATAMGFILALIVTAALMLTVKKATNENK